jgi:hypothetical protein
VHALPLQGGPFLLTALHWFVVQAWDLTIMSMAIDELEPLTILELGASLT